VRLLMQGAGVHSSPEAHFMAGGPASGKSRLLKDGKVNTPADAVDVNPDIVKTMLPEYRELVKRGDPLASSKVHEESGHVAKLLMNIALDRGHHVVVDGTGNSGKGRFAAKVAAARDAGHTTSVHYATVDTETAVKRAAERGKKTGRNVPEGYLRSAHRDVSKRFSEDIANMPGVHVRVFDTMGKKTKLLYEKGRHERVGKVKSKAGHAAFVAKGGG
jgi:predicted kinase